MKANEAPERIYCGNNGHGNLSYSNLPFPNAVEYTRTDAFIDKAEEYLYKQLNEGNMECGDIETFIDEFRKNYIKGE